MARGIRSLNLEEVVTSTGSDWAYRSDGAVFANRLDSAADIALYNFYEGAQVEPSFDSTNAPDAASRGSCKFTISTYDGDTSGELLLPFGADFSDGDSFQFAYSLYQDGGAFDQWNQRDGSATGEKHVIISHTSNSHGFGPDHAIVIGNIENQGMLTGYHYVGGLGQASWDTGLGTNCGSSYVYAGAADRGANTLTGNNPDTGLAWTSCEQDAARYGHLGARAESNENRRGFGDWLTGAFRVNNARWNAYLVVVDIGNLGSSNSRVRVYGAAPGEDWFLEHDKQNIRIGNASSQSGPFNGAWLGPYTTNRSEISGRQVSSRTTNIGGVTILSCGPGTPRGAGELLYNASTQKFSWKSSPHSHGTAKGFSYANNKTARFLPSSVDDQFVLTRLVGDCTFPTATITVISTATFPSAGTILVGPHPVDYTGKTSTTFTGCTMVAHKRPHGHIIRQDSFSPSAAFTTLVGPQDFSAATDVVNVASTANFPATGELVYLPRLLVDGSLAFSTYTGKTSTSFTGLAGKLGTRVADNTQVRLADFLVIDIEPALLPTSGTTTDSVTIAENRAPRVAHMADIIVKEGSTSLIPAPWVPSYNIPGPGEIVAIGTNTANDILPTPAQGMNGVLAWQYSLFFSYSGGVVVDDYSRAGAYVINSSGGHGAPDNVGAAIFDLETATWSRKDPTGYENFYKSPGSWPLTSTSGYPLYEINGTNVPSPCHGFLAMAAVPKLWDDSERGSVLRCGAGAMNAEANSTTVIHKFDVDTGLYSRPATNAFLVDGTSGTTEGVAVLLDKPRRRWWRIRGNANSYNYIQYLDANDWTVKNSATWPSISTPNGWESGAAWMFDGLIFRRGNPATAGTGKIIVWDPDFESTAPAYINIDVAANVNPQYQLPYVEYRGKLYSIPEVDIGVDTTKKYTFLYRLTPPTGDIKTGIWTADTITIPEVPSVNATTVGNSNASGAINYTRLFKHPRADCLVWIPNGQQLVYLIRPE
jgi:hypothetical protein